MSADSERLEDIVRQMQTRGYRLTPQRMAIVRAVLEDHAHPSVEQIYRQVSAVFPMLSLATVYKTLHVLKELGVVTELRVDGCSHYDVAAGPHAHFVCVECQAIIDLPAEVMVSLSDQALAEAGFRVLWRNVAVYGLCRQCQQRPETQDTTGA